MEQYTLFIDIETKIKRSIHAMQTFEAKALQMSPEGYYLCFSGGKDSQVIYALAKMAGVKFQAYYNITTVDPPELVHFIRKEYPEVTMVQPRTSMWRLITKKKYPPTRKVRYCCSELKERGGQGRFVVTGVRWQESKNRRNRGLAEVLGPKEPKIIFLNNDNDESRRMIESCQLKGKYALNPIIDWSEDEVWYFIHRYIKKYCVLYDKGFRRLGCIGCPLASIRQRKWELSLYPAYRRAYLRAFEQLLKERDINKTDFAGEPWKTPEDIYKWWLYGSEKKEKQIEGQLELDLSA